MLQAEQDALVLLAQSGNEKSLAMLFAALQPGLVRFAYKLCNNQQWALDATQEAWLKAIKSLPRLDDPRAFKSWLFRGVRWTVLDCVRKHRAEEKKQQSLAQAAESAEPLQVETNGWSLSEMINDLPEDEKQAIYLFYQEDMRLSEIALVQEVPVNTVKTRLYRGKAKLKLWLEKQDECR
ncbi:MAG: RNA polymerase sigma factor (sigma-70 family) [Paraglaciecola sp.]|jgi:RNA polymerase sigma factor (sigma-70 family)